MAQKICCNLTMTTATEMLSKYIAAEAALLDGAQKVRFGDRELTRADLVDIQQGRKEWERRVASEARIANSGSSIRFQTPDFR